MEPADYHIRITRAGDTGETRFDCIELVLDYAAPEPIADLEAGTVTDSAVVLTWTVPGDDGIEGTAAAYDLRYHTEPIGEENWDEATSVQDIGDPGEPGTEGRIVVYDLQPSTEYYFALRTRDEVFNWSEISNVLMLKTKDPVSVRRESWGRLKWEFSEERR